MDNILLHGSEQKGESSGVTNKSDDKVIVLSAKSPQIPFVLQGGERVILLDINSGELSLFSTRTGKCLRSYRNEEKGIGAILPLGNDTFAAARCPVSSMKFFIAVYSIDGSELDRIEYDKPLSALAPLGERNFLVGTLDDKVIEMHWSESGKLLRKKSVSARNPYRISANSNRFATFYDSGWEVFVFEIESFEHVGKVTLRAEPTRTDSFEWPAVPSKASSMDFSELYLVAGCKDGYIFVFNARTLRKVCEMQNHSDAVLSVHVMSNERILISGGHEGTINVQEAVTGAVLWQKRFDNEFVWMSFPLSNGRQITTTIDKESRASGSVLVHNVPLDQLQLKFPRPKPLREAFGKCISGIHVPADVCQDLITFERCSTSFEEWFYAHQILMIAVMDGSIPRKKHFNGKVSWWFKTLYLAAKDVKNACDDDVVTMERCLLEAKRIGVLEGTDTVLAAGILTENVSSEVTTFQSGDVLMLAQEISLETRIEELKKACKRYSRYKRSSQLVAVALQIIPIVEISVERMEYVGGKDRSWADFQTDYILGVRNVLLPGDDESNMLERLHIIAHHSLKAETLEKMNPAHPGKLEEGLKSCFVNVSELCELFLKQEIKSKAAMTTQGHTGCTDSIAENGNERSLTAETDSGVKSDILGTGNSGSCSYSAHSTDVKNDNGAELGVGGESSEEIIQASRWKDFKYTREEMIGLSQEELSSLWASYIVRNDDSRTEYYRRLYECIVSVIQEEDIFVELMLANSWLSKEDLLESVMNRMVEQGVRLSMGTKGKLRQFVYDVRNIQ